METELVAGDAGEALDDIGRVGAAADQGRVALARYRPGEAVVGWRARVVDVFAHGFVAAGVEDNRRFAPWPPGQSRVAHDDSLRIAAVVCHEPEADFGDVGDREIADGRMSDDR